MGSKAAWTPEKDRLLREGHAAGQTPEQISLLVDEVPGAVRYRASKLHLGKWPCVLEPGVQPGADEAFLRALRAAHPEPEVKKPSIKDPFMPVKFFPRREYSGGGSSLA